jgi:hypothetical protein
MTLDLSARIFRDAVKRGLLKSNPASDRELRLKITQRKGNFLEADELLALIDAASRIDQPVSEQTLARAEQARHMRQEKKTWKEIAVALGVAQSTGTVYDPVQDSLVWALRELIVGEVRSQGCSGSRSREPTA